MRVWSLDLVLLVMILMCLCWGREEPGCSFSSISLRFDSELISNFWYRWYCRDWLKCMCQVWGFPTIREYSIMIKVWLTLKNVKCTDIFSESCPSFWASLFMLPIAGVFGAVGAAGWKQRHPGLYHSCQRRFWHHRRPGHHHHVCLGWNAEPREWRLLCWSQVLETRQMRLRQAMKLKT